jgi:hypothetical protein
MATETIVLCLSLSRVKKLIFPIQNNHENSIRIDSIPFECLYLLNNVNLVVTITNLSLLKCLEVSYSHYFAGF